jgi:hypothetical protein
MLDAWTMHCMQSAQSACPAAPTKTPSARCMQLCVTHTAVMHAASYTARQPSMHGSPPGGSSHSVMVSCCITSALSSLRVAAATADVGGACAEPATDVQQAYCSGTQPHCSDGMHQSATSRKAFMLVAYTAATGVKQAYCSRAQLALNRCRIKAVA